MTVVVRAGGPGDAGLVGRLHAASRRATYRGVLSEAELATITDAQQTAKWSLLLTTQAETHRLYLAERDEQALGFGYLGPAPADERAAPRTGMLNAIHVRPGEIGTGVGRLLMRTCLDAFADRGDTSALLWVVEDNDRARRFYERGGWAPDGVTRRAPLQQALVAQIRYARPIG
ncbi:GNAT family N-acetyltransferase [Catellatospora tritici]|uniref:GNAT family N-acetyltransferase n=1 Tax=Catellatospora tritici TaxID=2851566 RepID=UPI001C2CF18C|nr:GNAT family N-acetyltransferase [Catellatospora tritici]MBV1849615.1 GNAT family N-acetyltransferase [Catellatospora tritici]